MRVFPPQSPRQQYRFNRQALVVGFILFLVSAASIPLGIGLFTFHYAGGFSYFSTDPKACANCHIMQSQYDSWQKSSHHTVATCVDCHLPHALIPKLIAKAENGYYHSKGFTLQDFAEPILIKEKNRHILQQNCETCHQELHSDMVLGARNQSPDTTMNCLHCHQAVGHGPPVGLGKIYP